MTTCQRARWLGLAVVALAPLACGEGAPVANVGASGPRADPAAEDPIGFGPLPDFRLSDARGQEVTLASLLGRPLVIGALFSTCAGPCPSVVRGLQQLQAALADTDVRLVVVSVNPAHDTSEVLARYAERVGAEPERWLFLTGPESEVHALVRAGFFLAVERGPAGAAGDPITHDTRLLAVDRRGLRRGWYDGTDERQIERLRRRMLHLAAEGRTVAGAHR